MIFFLIFAQNIDCGYDGNDVSRNDVSRNGNDVSGNDVEAVLTSIHNLCFRAKIRKIDITLHTPVLLCGV